MCRVFVCVHLYVCVCVCVMLLLVCHTISMIVILSSICLFNIIVITTDIIEKLCRMHFTLEAFCWLVTR